MEICLFFLLEDRKALGNSGVGNCIDLSQVADGIIKYSDGFEKMKSRRQKKEGTRAAEQWT